MLIFFDTEFTSLDWPAECLSIGLVTEDGQHSLYLERSDVNRSACSDFVLSTVLPLFGHFPEAVMPYAAFEPALRAWLERLAGRLPGPLRLVCDSGYDFQFLSWILKGRLPAHYLDLPIVAGLEDPELWEQAIKASFAVSLNPRIGRHHALADAYACREAYHQLIALHARRAGVPPD